MVPVTIRGFSTDSKLDVLARLSKIAEEGEGGPVVWFVSFR